MQEVPSGGGLLTDQTHGGAQAGTSGKLVAVQLPLLGLSVLGFPLERPKQRHKQ